VEKRGLHARRDVGHVDEVHGHVREMAIVAARIVATRSSAEVWTEEVGMAGARPTRTRPPDFLRGRVPRDAEDVEVVVHGYAKR
jgi:hypothetical protein